jgi:hypothetical protein
LCFLALNEEEEGNEMNANVLAALNWLPRVRQRWKHRQLGFVFHEAGRRPGVEPRVADAHAKFEHEARQAMREWLLL